MRRTAAVLLGLLVALLLPGTAHAHASLVSVFPDRDRVLTDVPIQVILTFSEPVTPVTDRIRVLAPDGSRADLGQLTAVGDQVLIPLKQDGPRGTYVVSFRVISADSHPVAGAYAFSVGAPSPPAGSTVEEEPATWPLSVAHFVGYAGLALLVGSAFVLLALWPRRLDRPLWAIWWGAGAVALSALAELALQIPYQTGELSLDGAGQVLGEAYGQAHLARLALLAAAVYLIRALLAGQAAPRAGTGLLLVIAAGGFATWPVAGHPAASPAPPLSISLDLVHLAAMSLWFGGLVALAVFLLPRASATELSSIVPAWSRWAGATVAALAVTGVGHAVITVGSFAGLVDTAYGWLILAKAGLLLAVVVVASRSRRLAGRVRAEEPGAAGRLRRLVLAETAVIVVVLGVTAALVQQPPSRSVPGVPAAAEPKVGGFVTRLTTKLYAMDVDIDPAAIGPNTIHLYAKRPGTEDPLAVAEWKVTAKLQNSDIEAIDVPVDSFSPDHAFGAIGLPVAGTWRFTITARTTDIDAATITVDVPVG